MKILEIRLFEGRNLYSRSPILKMVLDLKDFTEITTDLLPGFTEKLVGAIPTLWDHYCSLGKPGGFVQRLQEGTLLGHVVEHVALELQVMAGCDVIYGKTRQKDQENLYDVIFEYTSKEGAVKAARSAVALVLSLVKGEPVNPLQEVNLIRSICRKTELGPSTGAIAQAAKAKGIPVMRLGQGSIIQLGYGKAQRRVEATITSKTQCIGVDIAGDKSLTKYLLNEGGIPVPPGALAISPEEAVAIAKKLGQTVTIKPYDGNQGKGVSLNLTNHKDIVKAFEVASNFSDKILVEKHIHGRHYRLLVVGDKLTAAAERIPAFVRGDGVNSIKELIDLENRNPKRGLGHENHLTQIRIDPVVLMTLTKQERSLDDMPREGEVIYLRESANLSTGGIAVDVTDQVHPETALQAVRAARLLGLDVAGVDIVTENISKPLGTEGAVIEVNAAPGIRMHHYPSRGQSRDAAGAIIESLFPGENDGRIPIISITGTNGKTTITRLVSHILQRKGLSVGMTSTEGIYIKGRLARPGDTTGPQSARAVLRDPDVEVAVLETARGGIIRAGLGYDWSNVGIITNISGDHLGQDGVHTLEDLTYVKALVAEAVHPKGYCVLNADDPYVITMIKRVKSQIIYFSLAPDNIIVRRHLGAGGKAVFLKNGALVYAQGTRVTRLLPVKNIPLSLGGMALHNVQNVMAAVAGALALGVSMEVIKEGLLTFAPDLVNNPGRLNLLEVKGFKVLVDYGHNLAGYASIINLLPKLKGRRNIGVIGVPGDRLDQHIIEVGKIAGKGFKKIIIKEDCDLRGRNPGEVARLLQEGAFAAGAKANSIEVIHSEQEAVEKALSIASPGDVVVVFFEKLEPLLKAIELKNQEEEDLYEGEPLVVAGGEQKVLS